MKNYRVDKLHNKELHMYIHTVLLSYKVIHACEDSLQVHAKSPNVKGGWGRLSS